MLVLGRVEPGLEEARTRIRGAIASGAGLDVLRRVIEAQGGEPCVCDNFDLLPHASDRHEIRAETRGTTAVGTASWYGPGFHGKRTVCGEKYDQDGLTAAHGSWPCNTRVRVTLLSTNKSVFVRTNDLFPNHKRRLIDLSRGAAKEIGLIGPGIGRVRLEVLP